MIAWRNVVNQWVAPRKLRLTVARRRASPIPPVERAAQSRSTFAFDSERPPSFRLPATCVERPGRWTNRWADLTCDGRRRRARVIESSRYPSTFASFVTATPGPLQIREDHRRPVSTPCYRVIPIAIDCPHEAVA